MDKETQSGFDEKIEVKLDLDRFKVKELNCDGWIIPTPIEDKLKDLCEKNNALVDYLSMDK